MAQMQNRSDSPGSRRKRGFEAAASLMSRRVQKAAEGRGFAVSRLLTHWPEIAGAQLAAMTRPVRISHSRGGFGATLTLLTTGPVAPMVEMQLPELPRRAPKAPKPQRTGIAWVARSADALLLEER
ncbi:DciA family protein, partial [Paracoccus siganidrum]